MSKPLSEQIILVTGATDGTARGTARVARLEPAHGRDAEPQQGVEQDAP